MRASFCKWILLSVRGVYTDVHLSMIYTLLPGVLKVRDPNESLAMRFLPSMNVPEKLLKGIYLTARSLWVRYLLQKVHISIPFLARVWQYEIWHGSHRLVQIYKTKITLFFDVTTSNVSFLRGSKTQLRDVTAGPFTAGPLSDVTPLQCTADPTPEPHGRTSSRGPSYSFLVVTSIATIGTFEATRFWCFADRASQYNLSN